MAPRRNDSHGSAVVAAVVWLCTSSARARSGSSSIVNKSPPELTRKQTVLPGDAVIRHRKITSAIGLRTRDSFGSYELSSSIGSNSDVSLERKHWR